MSGAWRSIAAVGSAGLLAAACASTEHMATPAPNAGVYRVGNPYTVEGVHYVPKEQPTYEATGMASWYGAQFHGRLTADGEVFDRNKLTAAHPTLPLPSKVLVTNLENGKSIEVRVNDRGPFAGGRLIDLSERAADILGYKSKGLAQVKVTYLGRADGKGGNVVPPVRTPPDVATAVASAPTTRIQEASLIPVPVAAVDPPLAMPAPVTAPTPQSADTAVGHPVTAPTPLYVQAGAFVSLENANRVVAALKAFGANISAMMKDGQALYRVRLGPFGGIAEAGAALVRVQQLGHNDAKIVVD